MTNFNAKENWWLYIVFPVVVLGLGFGSSFLSDSGNNNEWYNKLAKAPWTPPSWMFSVVWSLLYMLLGVTIARTIVEKQYHTTMDKVQLGTLVSTIAIILIWPFVYFLGKSQPGGIALIILVVLLGLAYCILTGMDKRFVEMGCTLPLVAWGSFATTLALYPEVNK